jgi:hypothetical protein
LLKNCFLQTKFYLRKRFCLTMSNLVKPMSRTVCSYRTSFVFPC